MAGDAGSAGRISKTAFIGTSSAFFAVCMIASIVRFYIRFVHLRQFGWDDGFLIFGLLCLIAGMALLLVVMDVMYQTEAFVFLEPGEMLPEELLSDIGGMITKSFWYRKLSAGALTLMWLSICCVKFSFMAFFKRLIRQMPGMNRYWWFTTGFNIIVSAYGVAVYWASCPYFDESQSGEAMQCVMGDGLKVAVAYSTSLMVLDIFGDLFILAIPCILIYQIRVRFTQKIALSLTLCLTIIMIIITILRIAGLQYKGKLDSVWETFFIIVGAEIGLTLVAITAFRALYVTKNKNRKVHDTITTFNWFTRAKTAFKYYVSKATGKDVSHQSGGFENIDMGDGRFIKQEIPHGTMTGVKTFMDGNGRTYRPDFTGKQSTLSTMHTVTTLVEETGSERSHYRSQV